MPIISLLSEILLYPLAPLTAMKEALYWKSFKNGSVRCELCPHHCTIKKDLAGICGARKNIDGKLYTLNYARPVSVAVDTIE